MDTPKITISSESVRSILTDLINEYIRIEKSIKGVAYQQNSHFIRGQITLMTSFMYETWDLKNGQSYFAFLKYIVEKYELNGVWRINDL
ncbi:hypothetical protein BK120_23335 [Paenibacillus sp. FSL A5-0031]|uniref:hypothetical protein n=1 Tax=Paenibacillus sp. FSL A5-0031 TaxID=1920420 RepID=UPI00096EA57A|nr:hypothetical protein [Paenibacillus sp. FSL A5-0031]OME78675.1 hypothetical protein BK120_23335 [Paenibacillus sp. FSL A5-0031]